MIVPAGLFLFHIAPTLGIIIDEILALAGPGILGLIPVAALGSLLLETGWSAWSNRPTRNEE